MQGDGHPPPAGREALVSQQTERTSQARRTSAAGGGQTARILAIVATNLALVLAAIILASTGDGTFPDINTQTLAVGMLPVSAALGLVLACRRLDLSLPVILVLALALGSKRYIVIGAPILPVVAICALAGGVGLASALVTWYGRISSALWTGIVGFGLFLLLSILKGVSPGGGPWPWPWALLVSVGVLAGGAAILGVTGLVAPPSLPPIIRVGSRGIAGLAGAWIVAGVGVALASLSGAAGISAGDLQRSYPLMLSAAALGGAFILRGRWGALAAVLLTCLGHLAWSFAWNSDLGKGIAEILIPGAAPLVVIPLYLAIDWLVRRHTGESSPTGLLA